jgi:phytoene dehydrogenase-like protein
VPGSDNSIIIIGAGFAGLAAGIYARMNGYDTRIFEMHYKPGGLCTSWIRKGYTFDGCIHWLVGSSPKSGLHDMWRETGIAGRKFIDSEVYMSFEDEKGRTLILYSDVNRLEKNLLEFSPSDRKPIKEFTDGIRMCLGMDTPSKSEGFASKLWKYSSTAFTFIANGNKMRKWMKVSCASFAERFSDPLLRTAFREMWLPDFSMIFVLFTFAYLHKKNAGYPIGGSLPMSEAMTARYKELGGKIFFNSKVDKIITSEGAATGVRLADGTTYPASRIISAADGHATLYDMLEGKYCDDTILEPYRKDWPLFPPLIYVSIGVNRTFENEPVSVSGFSFSLKEPVMIGEKKRERLPVHVFNQDPTLAPAGKTSLMVMLETDYDYWKELAKNSDKYIEKKEEIGKIIISLLEQRFPGISTLVEVVDVATPLTTERYTGNWRGSFEGWLITPDNSKVLFKPMSQTISGLKNFYMCGQWVEPGGGLPTSVLSARRLIKKICREDNIRFRR